MIISSEYKIKVQTIHTPEHLTNEMGESITPQPMYIIREASREEYAAQGPLHNLAQYVRGYFYEVSTD